MINGGNLSIAAMETIKTHLGVLALGVDRGILEHSMESSVQVTCGSKRLRTPSPQLTE